VPAISTPLESVENLKLKISERLSKMEVMEGVLPTAAAPSESLARAARSITHGSLEAAERTIAGHLRRAQSRISVEPATATFVGSSALRQQLAGFANAGIAFFHATAEGWKLDPASRRTLGGNGAVSRVLVADQRVLLETSRVIVRFVPDAFDKRADILKLHQVFEVPTPGLPPYTVKAAAANMPARDAALSLMKEPSIIYAEPDFIEHIGQRYTPKDPEFSKQWHHAALQAELAWDQSTGKNISIAVIDNGFDTKHKDLKFGPLTGWFRSTPDHADADFVRGIAGMSDGDHGTACAGMIAAREGNKSGGCGVAFDANLSMIACLGDQVGTQSTLARAVAYAANPTVENQNNLTGADIIACSLGPNTAQWTMTQVLNDAITGAATQARGGKGIAIFWACTNGNFPIGSDEVCSHPRVSPIGRSTKEDTDDGSGFGPELEFLAPGVNVLIPSSGNSAYRKTTGTSFAAPCAAGVAALALSKNPALTAQQLRQLMRESCDKIGNLPYIEGRNMRFGFGRINANKAVANAIASVPSA
jgi:thermitase